MAKRGNNSGWLGYTTGWSVNKLARRGNTREMSGNISVMLESIWAMRGSSVGTRGSMLDWKDSSRAK